MGRPRKVRPETEGMPSVAQDGASDSPAVHVPRRPKYVVVASKLPMNLELQNCAPKEARITGQFGSTVETVMVKTGDVVLIRGTGYPRGQVPKGYPKAPHINEAGFAVTRNVPYDFWETYVAQNRDADLIRNGLLTAEVDLDSLDDKTADFAGLNSGLEPVNPDGDPRSPKPLMPLIGDVETAERSAA